MAIAEAVAMPSNDPAKPLDLNNMRGLFDLPEDGLVSSLALTPDGCYVFAAFGGGEVRLYAQALRTVGAASRNGAIVAQIKSKGMFSNTKMDCHVEASEDGRFVFTGLLRGSSEMLALDISDLPRWETLPTREEASLAASRFDLNRRIRTYAHADVKLKGFGAAAAVRTGPSRSEWGKEYRLFCGRGIKNIHVWSFKPDTTGGGGVAMGRGGGRGHRHGHGGGGGGEWSCIYDTHTNGATVELVAFRNGGLEGISKSTDANVRVWDLSGEDKQTKPSFRDISNSKDTRVVFGDYAYGGTTVLSLVKLDAPAVANRMEIALPETGVTSPLTGRASPSGRGKRHCRMLKDLAGTQDGRHVVLVCSDGMVLYHRHTQAVKTMRLQPLEGLGVDEEDFRPTVSLSLVGRAGLPVLMIAGGRGSGGAANLGGEHRDKELELMALPRSEAQQREDSHVTLLDTFGRLAPMWPEGRRLTPEDNESVFDDDDYDEDDGDSSDDNGGHDGEEEEAEGGTVEPDGMDEGREGGTGGDEDARAAEAEPEAMAVTLAAEAEAAATAAAAAAAAVAYGNQTVDVQSPAPATPVPLRVQRVSAPETPIWRQVESEPKSPPTPLPPPQPLALAPTASPAQSPMSVSPPVTPVQSRVSTPGSSGRKRARVDSGSGAGKSPGSGGSPAVRTPGGGPSPGSGSRGGRKRRGSGGAAGAGRSRGGSNSNSGAVASSPSAIVSMAASGGTGGTGGGGRVEIRAGAAGAEAGTGARAGLGLDVGEGGAAVSIGREGGEHVPAAPGVIGSQKGSAPASIPAPAAIVTGGVAVGVAGATGQTTTRVGSEPPGKAGSGSRGGGGGSRGSGENGGVGGVSASLAAAVAAAAAANVAAAAAAAATAAEVGAGARARAVNGAGGGAPAVVGEAAEEGEEKKRRANNSGSAAGGGGKAAAGGKRVGKKRPREDQDKGAGEESGQEEGEPHAAATTPAPLKRGRRGGGEEGTAAPRGSGKTRRTNPHASLDEDGDRAGGNGSRGGGGGSGAGGGSGGGDQLLLRDRRSRIAARALRSSGNVFDIGAIVKGMGSSWNPGGEQQEELRVVRISERDDEMDPPIVPVGLVNFLAERETRRTRETTPISLEQARKRYRSGVRLLPHTLSAPAAAAASDDGKPIVATVSRSSTGGSSFTPEESEESEANISSSVDDEGEMPPPRPPPAPAQQQQQQQQPAAEVVGQKGSGSAATLAARGGATGLGGFGERGSVVVAGAGAGAGAGGLVRPLGGAAGASSGDGSSDGGGGGGRIDVVPQPEDSVESPAVVMGDADGAGDAATALSETATAASASAAAGGRVRNSVVGGEAEVSGGGGGGSASGGAGELPAGGSKAAGADTSPSVGKRTPPRSAAESSGVDPAAEGTAHALASTASAASVEVGIDPMDVVDVATDALRGAAAATPRGAGIEGGGAAVKGAATGASAPAGTPAAAALKKSYHSGGSVGSAPGAATAAKAGKGDAGLRRSSKPGERPFPSGPDVFPPPLETVIEMEREDGERGSGGGAIDRLYGDHCLEREAAARAFFDEHDMLRRRFQAAVDSVEMDKAVECAGLELRNGCRTAQTLKRRLKTRWREGTILQNGGGGLGRCTSKEVQQATLRWQEQIRTVIADHREVLRNLLGRQRLEAGALQMSQEMEVPKGNAPPLMVRFAFPRMFDEVAERHGIKP